MEHYPEGSCHFATVKKMLKGFNLVFSTSTLWRIGVFIRENNVVHNLLLEFSTFCFQRLFLLSLLSLSFNNPEGREVIYPKHRAHVLLPYTNTKSCASCFICDDFYKNFGVLLRMHLQRSRSIQDSLKRVLNVFRRRPLFGAPKEEKEEDKRFLYKTESFVFVLLLFHLLECTQVLDPFQRAHPLLSNRPGVNGCMQLPL